MALIGSKIIPVVLEVCAFTSAYQRLWNWTIEAEMPNGRIVVNGLPSFHPRQKRIHHHELLCFCGELRGVSIRNHQSDVVSDNPCLLHTQRFCERVNADRRGLHIQTV